VREGVPVTDGVFDELCDGVCVLDCVLVGVMVGVTVPVTDGVTDDVRDEDCVGVTEGVGVIVEDGVVEDVAVAVNILDADVDVDTLYDCTALEDTLNTAVMELAAVLDICDTLVIGV
jgi:hypothetical protein